MNRVYSATMIYMLTVTLLGTGAAAPTAGRDNTCLALDDGTEITLIDASGSPLKRLADAGLPRDRLTRVIITHEHLDHTFGLPSLVQSLWLLGRREPLPIYALDATWRRLDRLLEAYAPSLQRSMIPLERHTIEPGPDPILTTSSCHIRVAPGQHSVPTVGLRVDTASGTLVYTSDTAPCASIAELAQGADLLLHEATFLAGAEEEAETHGHSTALQAGQVATAVGARRLALVHFTPPRPEDLQRLHEDATRSFGGPIVVPSDLERMHLL